MKNLIISSLLVTLLVCGCATTAKEQKQASIWTFEKDAIVLNFKAEKQLNLKNKKPRTLMVCVYQLKNTTAFNKLTSDQTGLQELQECQVFDLSMAESTRIVVNPGQDVNMRLDRAEDAQYIAVVAGYSMVDKSRIVRLYQIPTLREKKLFWRSKTLKPSPVQIKLTLGASQLQDPRSKP